MSKGDFSEDALVERPAIALFAEVGWQTANGFHEFDYGPSPLGRDSKGEVVLLDRLRRALQRLNPDLPNEAINLGIEDLTRDRSAMSLAAANREIYQLLKNGVRVSFRDDHGDEVALLSVQWLRLRAVFSDPPAQPFSAPWRRAGG